MIATHAPLIRATTTNARAALDCKDCGTNVTLFAQTSNDVEDLSWTVKNIDTNRIVMSNPSSLVANQSSDHNECLEFEKHIFVLTHDANRTSTSNLTHELKAGESILS